MWSENQKNAELQTFIEKNKNIVCKLLAVRHGIATYKYISQGRRGTQLLDPCNSSLIAPKGEKGVNQATSRLSDRDIPSSPDNYESISSMFRRAVLFFWCFFFVIWQHSQSLRTLSEPTVFGNKSIVFVTSSLVIELTRNALKGYCYWM